jgi:hypothetical protein
MAATTAVVAGTAGAVRHHQEQKYAGEQAQQQAGYDQAYAEGAAAAQQQAAYAAPAPAAPAPAGGSAVDYEQLKQLGELHAAGVLTDEEFAAAKAKLLGA